MKKIYILIAIIGLSNAIIAQSFSDNFETYMPGDYIGVVSSNWTTWSGTTGGAADAQVDTTNSYSGNQSIYFNSTSTNGGPQDVVLPFGGAYDNGRFRYEMMMYMETNTDAYFNFQAEQAIGTAWAMDCRIEGNGSITMSNTNGALLTGTFPIGQWVRLSYDINLNLNEWTVYVDSNVIGSFANTVNKIASIDIYPMVISGSGNSLSSFWIDDVFYEYTTLTLPNLDGAVTSITGLNGLAGQTKKPIVTVKNLGQTDITSFDIEVTYDGASFTESVTGVSITSLNELEIALSGEIVLTAGANDISATISNINGTASDDDPANDMKTISIDPIIPAEHKRVFVEEATGTWCQWCPRGAVWMARMQERYPDHFVGVAVHNGDPMTVSEYDSGLGDLISGYPSSVVDRGADIDPSNMEIDFIERVQLAPTAILCESVDYTPGNATFDVHLQVVLLGDITSSWKVAFVVSEDSVTGSGSGWNQANAYSGGGNGELTGAGLEWHNEPFSVPASKMIYNHVARAIAPSFSGDANSFPQGGTLGDTFNFTTTFTIDNSWELEQLHVAGVLFNPSGMADNAISYHFDAALNRQCQLDPTGSQEISTLSLPTLQAYPSPASNEINIRISENTTNARLQLRDMLGKVVYSAQLGAMNGINDLKINTNYLYPGIYLVELIDNEKATTTKFIKN